MKLEFSRRIFENNRVWNVMKTSPVGVGLFQADRRIDLTKLYSLFPVWWKRLKIKSNISEKWVFPIDNYWCMSDISLFHTVFHKGNMTEMVLCTYILSATIELHVSWIVELAPCMQRKFRKAKFDYFYFNY
jgi:hypothetical protein